MRRKLLRGGVLAALALSAQETPTIRVNTRLVQVSVIVRDKNGPVANLTKDDFQIFDKGKEQKVAVFSVATTRPNPGAKPAPLPAGVYSNRIDRKGTEPLNSVTVVLIDLLNTRFQDQAMARNQILKFLKTLEPQDRIALYVLSNGVKILHDFTQDQERLMRMVAKLRGEVSTAVAVADEPDVDVGDNTANDALNAALGQMQDFYMVNRAKTTLEGLEAIGNHLARVPGRKNLVWVSGSFPFSMGIDDTLMDPRREHRTFNEEADRASRALNNANVAIYPVDARGLIGDPSGMLSADKRGVGSAKGPPRMGNNIPTGLDTMQALADKTGGKAYFNTNDLHGAIRKAVEDAEIAYTVGFYPATGDLDQKFHELKVKVDRKGVDVRHRKGYFASEWKPPDAKEMDQILRDTVTSGLEASVIGIAGRLNRLDKPQAGALQVVASIDVSTVTLDQQQDRWSGVLQVVVIQQGSGGEGLDSTSETINLNLKAEMYQKMLKEGMLLAKGIVPKEGLHTIKVVIQDRKNGAVGSLRLPIPMPPKA